MKTLVVIFALALSTLAQAATAKDWFEGLRQGRGQNGILTLQYLDGKTQRLTGPQINRFFFGFGAYYAEHTVGHEFYLRQLTKSTLDCGIDFLLIPGGLVGNLFGFAADTVQTRFRDAEFNCAAGESVVLGYREAILRKAVQQWDPHLPSLSDEVAARLSATSLGSHTPNQ